MNTHGGIEHATSDTVEDPNINGQSTPEGCRDVHQAECPQRCIGVCWVIGQDGCLSSDEGQEQEHESATEFADDDSQSIADAIWDTVPPDTLLLDSIAADIEDAAELRLGNHGEKSMVYTT